MHKSTAFVDFESESVLSTNPWLFVELWLQREGCVDALPYWRQARRFAEAAEGLSVEAAPLVLYYSLLNATKTLLVVRGESHGAAHGVSGDRPESAKAHLGSETVKISTGGVLPALSLYLKDTCSQKSFNLKELLWNLPFVHRAFMHTYKSSKELFIPLELAGYVQKDRSSEAWFEAKVVRRYANSKLLNYTPSSFISFEFEDDCYVRRKRRFKWISGRFLKKEFSAAIRRLGNYHAAVRRIIVPISGNSDLWYLKINYPENNVSGLSNLSIIFAVMHRLSELARYDPRGLDRHLIGRANWLIAEFVEHASTQFIDQIASEITGLQFWRPGIRT